MHVFASVLTSRVQECQTKQWKKHKTICQAFAIPGHGGFVMLNK